MIEFVLKNRRLRLHPDGVIYSRAHRNGVETKSEKWTEVKFHDCNGYKRCHLTLDGVHSGLLEHRIVYYAHNQSWNIWDTSKDNVIDHKNRIKSDNRIDNLHITTQQENSFNTDAKGYSWHKCKNKFQAYIVVNGIKKHLGYFEKEEDARNSYLKEKEKYHIINLN